MEFLLQSGARLRDLGEELFVFGQKVVHVAGAGVGAVRVLEVEVEVAGLDRVDRDAPGLLVFHAGFEAVGLVAPPKALALEFLDADGFALVVALGAGRIGVLVIPDVGGGRAFGEEEEVGADAGVGIEDAVGQANDGVEVALGDEGFLDAGLTPSPKRVPSGSTSPARPPGLRIFMRSTRKRSAVSRVRNSAG